MVLGSSSRRPIDADGCHALRNPQPRSTKEPELELDGKVVLFGRPVLKISGNDASVFSSDDEEQAQHQQQHRSAQGTLRSKAREDTRDMADDADSRPVDDVSEDDSSEQCKKDEQSGWGNWNWFAAGGNSEPSGGNWFSLVPDASSRTSKTGELIDLTDKNDDDEASREKPTSPSTSDTFSLTTGWTNMFGWGSTTEQEDDKKDDDSTVDGQSTRLFGELSSLPSVNDDVTISGTSLQSADFDGRDDQSHGRGGVDRKVHEIIVSRDVPTRVDHAVAGNNTSRRKSGAEEMSAYNRRQLLVKELRSAIATYGRYDLRCANVSAALGDLLNETEEHDQAVKLHKDAVSIYSVKLGDDHTTTINAKFRLANVLADANEFDEAIATFYNVTAMRRALKGDRDPSVAEGLALMARCLKRNGEYQQAIKELKRALKIYRESLGDSNENVSRTVDEIASLYVTLGDFEKSAAILEEVVKLKAATQGMQSKAVAETLISLAMTYECSEQFTQAMKSLKKAYKIYTELDGYSSQEATATLKKIAILYEATGDFNRASIAFLGVLRGQKIHLGEDHLLVGETYCKLGHALRQTGQLEKALKCMKEALPIFVGKGVEMHDVEKIAEIMHEMALIYKEKRHFNESARIFKQELSVRRKIGQPEFPCIARTLNLLGVTEYEMKNNSRALKYLVEALTIFQERSEHGIECAEVLYNTGLVFTAVRNKDRALEAFTEAERIFREQGLSEDDIRLSNTQKEVAKIRLTSNNRRPR